jgi:hypothetical protein
MWPRSVLLLLMLSFSTAPAAATVVRLECGSSPSTSPPLAFPVGYYAITIDYDAKTATMAAAVEQGRVPSPVFGGGPFPVRITESTITWTTNLYSFKIDRFKLTLITTNNRDYNSTAPCQILKPQI